MEVKANRSVDDNDDINEPHWPPNQTLDSKLAKRLHKRESTHASKKPKLNEERPLPSLLELSKKLTPPDHLRSSSAVDDNDDTYEPCMDINIVTKETAEKWYKHACAMEDMRTANQIMKKFGRRPAKDCRKIYFRGVEGYYTV